MAFCDQSISINNSYSNVLSITELQELSRSQGKEIKIYLDPLDEKYLLCVVRNKTKQVTYKFNVPSYGGVESTYSNNPLIANIQWDNAFNNKLLEHLHATLPNYMIPNILLCLDKLPRTSNGKIDRGALPAPELVTKAERIPPKTVTAVQICTILEAVLGLPKDTICMHDSFVRLGGHSVLAIKLVNKINQQFSQKITPVDVLRAENIEEFVQFIETNLNTQIYDRAWKF